MASLRGAASAGLDTNARRQFGPRDPNLFGFTDPDLIVSGLLAAAGRLSAGPLELGGSYGVAARKFLAHTLEDTLGQEVLVEAAGRPLRTVTLALGGHARDRRGGPRLYSDLQGSLSLRWRAVPELEVELSAGAHRFMCWTFFDYSFSAPEAVARVRYRIDRRHALSLQGEWGQRRYNALAEPVPGAPPSPMPRRQDGVLSAVASYSFRGWFQFSTVYRYFGEDSNSHGQTARIHRLDLTYGTPLPWEWLLLTQLTLQLADYPEGVFIPLNPLDPDEEPHNALSVKLVRPLGKQVDLELRYGLYVSDFPHNELSYRRQVASVGLAARM